MTTARFLKVSLLASALFALPVLPSHAQQAATSASDRKLLSDFSKKAKDYVSKEHMLAQAQMKPTSDVAKLQQQRKQLRDAVQQSRPNAQQGDYFTPDAAAVFRKVLLKLLNGPEGKKIKTSLDHAEPGAPAKFKVNAEFPNQNGQPIQSVPPTVLKVLPELPRGLEYCIAGKTLALRDSAANMVVDYLPNALQ
ncbi:hypothetical protein [Occallatibacter savannae]|uniref:hypothetical protein n=1 Tax=Occallatibacter savannae TaxID=1002691 RepID=UPI000D697A9B|nr:hypothetical protein [Occallatibacter savannae]